jgi:hypothetical protein
MSRNVSGFNSQVPTFAASPHEDGMKEVKKGDESLRFLGGMPGLGSTEWR